MKAYCAWDAASRMLSMLAEGERPHRKGRPADKQERGKPQLMTISSSSFQLDVVRERERERREPPGESGGTRAPSSHFD